MKLKGVKINNLGALKKYFDLKEAWGNIYNGVLLDCQKMLAEQNVDIAESIVEALEAYGEKNRLDSLVSPFYGESGWNIEELWKRLEPLSSKSRDTSGNNFYTRNFRKLGSLVHTEVKCWSKERAALVYLFLLLMLQVKPREEILEEDFKFLKERLLLVSDGEERRSDRKNGGNLHPYHSGVFYLADGKIVNGEGKVFSPKEERISSFAYTDSLGFIGVTEDGRLSLAVEPNIRHELGEAIGKGNGEALRITMVAAYGQIYIALLENGRAISNVEVSIDGWKDIRWVGAGLNSITAIRGNSRNLLELGSCDSLMEFSDVTAVYTLSSGRHRYGVLKENGTLIMDDGYREKGVSAANLCLDGYVYAVGRELFLRNFDSEKKRSCKVLSERPIVEVCRYRSAIYAYGEDGQIFSMDERQFS